MTTEVLKKCHVSGQDLPFWTSEIVKNEEIEEQRLLSVWKSYLQFEGLQRDPGEFRLYNLNFSQL